jgi:hypothetical protein
VASRLARPYKYYMHMKDYIIPIAHVSVVGQQDLNIYISICIVTRHVHVFKYSESRGICSYKVCEDQGEAHLFIEAPLAGWNEAPGSESDSEI